MLWVPEPDGFVADGDASLGQKIFNEWSGTPAVVEVEPVVQSYSVTDDICGARSRANLRRL
jgi:hypothetical protein